MPICVRIPVLKAARPAETISFPFRQRASTGASSRGPCVLAPPYYTAAQAS